VPDPTFTSRAVIKTPSPEASDTRILLDFWVYTSPANRLSAFSATLPRPGNAGS